MDIKDFINKDTSEVGEALLGGGGGLDARNE